jgi:hypothetical protein
MPRSSSPLEPLTPSPSSLPPSQLTAAEAGIYLRIALVTLAQWRLVGKGPVFIRMGKAIRYRLSDLHAWMDANAVGKVA